MDKMYGKFLRLGVSLAAVGIETRDDEAAYFCTPKGASVIGWAGVDGIHYCKIRGFGDMIFAVSPMNSAPNYGNTAQRLCGSCAARFFVRLCKFDAGGLSPVKENLCKMTEKMQANAVQSPKGGLCAVLPYVHPIAEDFETLLRLLLACGDAAALEQAWQWDEAQFGEYLAENPPTAEQTAVLSEIGAKLNLSPLDNPWRYLRNLRENFDYGKIKYTEDILDPEMNSDASAPEWEVRFGGGFWASRGRKRPGTEIDIGKRFDWAGRQWLVPAVYICGEGVVADLCMRVETEEIRAFMEKWDPNGQDRFGERPTEEQWEERRRDDPFNFGFRPKLALNGRELRTCDGFFAYFNPCLSENEPEAMRVVERYALNRGCGWVISRHSFSWQYKRRPKINTLFLTMEQEPEEITVSRFRPHESGEVIRFANPIKGTEYTLTVQALERRELPDSRLFPDNRIYPTNFTEMSYTLSPEPSEMITVSDCEHSDAPLETEPSDDLSALRAGGVLLVIGGADDSAALGGNGQGRLRTACSSLRFEPVRGDIEWSVTLHEKRFEDLTPALI